LKFKIKQRLKKDLNQVLNLELPHHMEQIQIRQLKMPAAQSFIQILGTFLATFFILIAALFYFIKIASSFRKRLKALVLLDLVLKNLTTFSKGKKCQRGVNLRI